MQFIWLHKEPQFIWHNHLPFLSVFMSGILNCHTYFFWCMLTLLNEWPSIPALLPSAVQNSTFCFSYLWTWKQANKQMPHPKTHQALPFLSIPPANTNQEPFYPTYWSPPLQLITPVPELPTAGVSMGFCITAIFHYVFSTYAPSLFP